MLVLLGRADELLSSSAKKAVDPVSHRPNFSGGDKKITKGKSHGRKRGEKAIVSILKMEQ